MSTLPRGWKTATLADVAIWSSGGTPKSSTSQYYGGEIPWAVTGDLTEGPVVTTAASLTQEGLRHSNAKVVPENTVLIAMYGASIGRLGFAGRPLATNQAIATAQVNRDVLLPKFLFYYLRSQRSALVAAGKGGAQPNISQSILKGWPMPVPPLAEQDRIVRAVEEEFSHVDDGLAAVESARSRLRLCRIALLRRSFEPLFATVDTTPLGKMAASQLGRMLSGSRETGRHAKPYLRNRDVQWGHINVSNLPTMDFSGKDAERFRLSEGDVLVCEGGEVGRSAVWRSALAECYYQKAIHRVRCSEALLPDFLRYFFEFLARTQQFGEATSGMTIAHLPQEDLRSLPVPAADITTQGAVSDRLQRWDETEQRTRDALKHLVERANALRSAILAAAFSGRLLSHRNVQDADGVVFDRRRADETTANAPKYALIRKSDINAST